MEYVLPGLILGLVLLFLFRRQIRAVSRNWAEGSGHDKKDELREIIAREKKRMEEQRKKDN